MKKLIALLLCIVMALSLIACGAKENSSATTSASENNENDLLAQIKARGTLIIATEGDWAPWTYHDENNVLTGFDVEIGRKIAEKLGVEAVFEETAWDSILAGVDAGRFDIACNGVSYDDTRAEKYTFSEPYAYTHIVLIVRGDETGITDFPDLKGKQTANTASSIYASIAEDYGATVLPIDTLQDTMDLLLQGRIDATINAQESFQDYMAQHPEANLKAVAQTTGDIMCFPVRKTAETASFIEAVNEALQELRDSGELSALSIRFFGTDVTEKE